MLGHPVLHMQICKNWQSKKSENATKKDEKDSWKCVYIQQRSADLLSIWRIFLLKKKKKIQNSRTCLDTQY